MLWLWACTPPPKPDLVLITVDTLRADRVGAYGDPLAQTPNLDGFAQQAILFRDAVTTAPTTLPAHASLLTGQWPRDHGARDNTIPLTTMGPGLPAQLAQAGWATAAFVSASVLAPSTGIAAGFSVYDAPSGEDAERSGEKTVASALAWWNKTPSPRFLWVHLYDPHRPWPATGGDPYRADVTTADRALGPLLAALPAEVVVVITADHGESLWEHGERDHGLLVHRAATRVPLLIRVPGLDTGPMVSPKESGKLPIERPAGIDEDLQLTPVPDAPRARRVVEGPVSLVQVAGTLAGLAGIPFESKFPGLLDDKPQMAAYAETWYPAVAFGWSHRCMVQSGSERWYGPLHPFGSDISTDPGEGQRLPPSPVLQTIALDRGCKDRPLPAFDSTEKLRMLGYMEGAGELPEGDFSSLHRLYAAEAEADPVRAEGLYRALLQEQPRLWRAWDGLAVVLAGQGRYSEALELLKNPEIPVTSGLLTQRGRLALGAGKEAEALAIALELQKEQPRSAEGFQLEVLLRLRQGDPPAMEAAALRGLAIAPQDPRLLYGLGLARLRQRRDVEALESLLAAQKAGSEAADLEMYVGSIHERAGRLTEALAAYGRWRDRAPTEPRAWAAPAWMLYQNGNCADARPLADGALRLDGTDARMQEVVARCP